MIRLKSKYQQKTAVVVMGGPSIIERQMDLGRISKDRYTVFLESKALTPKFLSYGLVPDFYLMFFPEKCQSNTLQHVMYQSLLAGIELKGLLREEFIDEYFELKENYSRYFETWNPIKGPQKKFKFKGEVKLKGSPFDVITALSQMPIISRIQPQKRCAVCASLNNPMYFYNDCMASGEFSLDRYFNMQEQNGEVFLNGFGHLNSAAIALFPVLNYMGFRKIYFCGMDMSMMGSMEYSSLYTFKSIRHFEKFFNQAVRGQVFSGVFKANRKKFMRPPYEFDNFKEIFLFKDIEFINIYEPFEFAQPLPGIKNISFKEFLNE